MRGNKITSIGARLLGKVHTLDLRENQGVTDYGIVALGNVHTLDITGTGVTDIGGAALMALGTFRTLKLDSSAQRAAHERFRRVCVFHDHRSRMVRMIRAFCECTIALLLLAAAIRFPLGATVLAFWTLAIVFFFYDYARARHPVPHGGGVHRQTPAARSSRRTPRTARTPRCSSRRSCPGRRTSPSWLPGI